MRVAPRNVTAPDPLNAAVAGNPVVALDFAIRASSALEKALGLATGTRPNDDQ